MRTHDCVLLNKWTQLTLNHITPIDQTLKFRLSEKSTLEPDVICTNRHILRYQWFILFQTTLSGQTQNLILVPNDYYLLLRYEYFLFLFNEQIHLTVKSLKRLRKLSKYFLKKSNDGVEKSQKICICKTQYRTGLVHKIFFS